MTPRTAICDVTRALCLDWHGDRVETLVLTGSLARDEATVTNDERGNAVLLGDAEFLLVWKAGPLPAARDMDDLGRAIASALAARRIIGPVTVSAVKRSYLRRLRPSIFAYELRSRGSVVHGDAGILDLVPAFPASSIPLEDAWWMLCNRLVEQLELIGETSARGDDPGTVSGRLHYRTVKLFLDMATSLLVFLGRYEPSYAQRARRLQVMARDGDVEQLPFPLGPFSDEVAACTSWKLTPVPGPSRGDGGLCQRALGYARSLARWELGRLAAAASDTPDRTLIRRWMQRQSPTGRVRGWVRVLREEGWQRSWRQWPRWIRLAAEGSPRHWLYATAIEAVMRIPTLGDEAPVNGSDGELEALRRCLPLPTSIDAAAGVSAWQRLCGDIASNYHRFLVPTRS